MGNWSESIMSKKSNRSAARKMDAFVAFTKKVFIKKDKNKQFSLFDEKQDDLRQRYEIQLPVYAWKRK